MRIVGQTVNLEGRVGQAVNGMLSCIFLLVGLGIAGNGAHMLRETRGFTAVAINAPGEVVDIVTRTSSNRDIRYAPKVRFHAADGPNTCSSRTSSQNLRPIIAARR